MNKLFAIVLDDKVISAPNIRDPGRLRRDQRQLHGRECQRACDVLRSGALPAPLKVIEERSVGAGSAPILIRAGTIASIVACVLTVSLMLVYYGIST